MNKKELKAITIKEGKKLIAIASTENPDRVGDSLKMEDWDLTKFKNNPVLQAGHDYQPQYTVGIAKNIRVEDKKLIFEPHFHTITQLAKEIKEMYESEPPILKAWSVGFIPGALQEKGGKNELLEVSAVAVPANAECLTTAKGYGDKEANNIKEWIKTEKEMVEIETGETNDHVHIAKFDDETGIGSTSTDNNHNHKIEEFKVLESEGHTHGLDFEKSGHKKKPKKRKEDKQNENIHICSFKSREGYDDFEQSIREEEDKEYRVIFGLKDDKTEELEFNYQQNVWTENEAKTHCETANGKFIKAKEKTNKKTEEKSPACRLDDESKDDCVARKIPELIDEGRDREQAVAMANSMCERTCNSKKNIDYKARSKRQNSYINKLESEIKEGRILSKKNRGLINGAIESMEKTTKSLVDLLEKSDIKEDEKQIEKEVEKEKTVKKEIIKKIAESKNQKVLLKALQKISKQTNETLREIKS